MPAESVSALPDTAVPMMHPRVERILDTAGDLLLRWGYKRVTIDDIAHYSAIGKGTIYLHWKTRDALFQTVVLREMLAIWRVLLREMHTDAAAVRLSRLMRSLFLTTMSRPLARALFTGDREVLGKLAASDSSRALRSQQLLASAEFLMLLRDTGLLRTDRDLTTQGYALQATVSGFFLREQASPDEAKLPLEQKADALAQTVCDAFEPVTIPPASDLLVSTNRLLAWAEQLCTQYAQHIDALSTSTATRAE